MKKNYFWLFVDILIALVFVLLFNTRVLGGLPFHEIAGLGIGLGFLVHILLNSHWIKTVTLRLFDPGLAAKTRFGYFLNILLFVSMILIIVSGLMISRVLFPGFSTVNERWFHALHVGLSYFTLVLVGIHVGLHGQWIMGMMKRIFKIQTSSLPMILTKVALVLVILFGGIQILETQVAPQIAKIGSTSGVDSKQIFPESSRLRIEGRDPSGETHGERPHGERDGQNEGDRKANPSGVILLYTGIIGVFAVITFYGEKHLKKNKPLS